MGGFQNVGVGVMGRFQYVELGYRRDSRMLRWDNGGIPEC